MLYLLGLVTPEDEPNRVHQSKLGGQYLRWVIPGPKSSVCIEFRCSFGTSRNWGETALTLYADIVAKVPNCPLLFFCW